MTSKEPFRRALATPCEICGAHYMCQPCTTEKQREYQASLEDHPDPLIPAPYDGSVIDPTQSPQS